MSANDTPSPTDTIFYADTTVHPHSPLFNMIEAVRDLRPPEGMCRRRGLRWKAPHHIPIQHHMRDKFLVVVSSLGDGVDAIDFKRVCCTEPKKDVVVVCKSPIA